MSVRKDAICTCLTKYLPLPSCFSSNIEATSLIICGKKTLVKAICYSLKCVTMLKHFVLHKIFLSTVITILISYLHSAILARPNLLKTRSLLTPCNFCLYISKGRFLNINKTVNEIFGHPQTFIICEFSFRVLFRGTGHSARVGVQPVCASLTSLHLLLSSIYPSTRSFINSAIHSSLHAFIQTSIHLLRPLTHFTYKCLCW